MLLSLWVVAESPYVIRNTNTRDWLDIKKNTPIAQMEAANQVPPVSGSISVSESDNLPSLTEAERQALLMDKLDLTGLESWPEEQANRARSLLREYHDIFSVEKNEIGHTKETTHKIVLNDPEAPPFKERFRRIPPPQVDEVREHLKLMLDAGAI